MAGQPALAPPQEPGGHGELAFQGYYLGGRQQELMDTTGLALRFQQFLPAAGFLSGHLEGYSSQNRFQTGENFLELSGFPWAGRYWTVTGGDFRAPASLVEFPFNNLFTPEIEARGIQIQAAHGETRYALFGGEVTLTAGPRVAYRILAPQRVAGISVVRKAAPHLLVGLRLMQFSASQQSIAGNPYLFPQGRAASMVRTAALQSLYTPAKDWKLYAEVSRPMESPSLTSFLAGLSWESTAVTLKANYGSQGVFYFPLAGYFLGDRRGPYVEARLRPWQRIELYGSASRYANNLERNASLPTLTSDTFSAGVSVLAPGKVSINGQLSTVKYRDWEPGEEPHWSNNRQITANLSRSFGRHTVQVGWREIRLELPGVERQRAAEAGDTYQSKHFSIGGAVRYQQARGAASVNSLFARGIAQVNVGRFAAYANVDIGSDLANQTVFATEAYRTSVVGMSVRLPGRWTLQSEAFRNQLNFALNEESVFLLQNAAVSAGISPGAASLSGFRQSSLFFRLSKEFRWGAGVPVGKSGQGAAGSAVRLTGSVEGTVRVKTLGAATNAAAVRIALDGGRSVLSGADGQYRFDGVPEGPHEVRLMLEELPAEFDPAEVQQNRVMVQPRHVARADFEVFPLASVAGQVAGPEGAAVEAIAIRLEPGNRYTRTRGDGSFTFYNVREGDYTLAIDADTLPAGAVLADGGGGRAVVRIGEPAPRIEFRFILKPTAKPIRRVLER